MEKKTNTTLIFILALLSFSLIGAYIIEYGLGYKPCKLCIYQRIPHIVSVLIVLNILLIKKYIKPSLLILAIVSLCGLILAFYHFGIEQGFFNESFICGTKSLSQDLSKEDVLKQLKENTVGCKDVNFKVFSLSLASINAIFSFVLFTIFIRLYKNYEVNR